MRILSSGDVKEMTAPYGRLFLDKLMRQLYGYKLLMSLEKRIGFFPTDLRCCHNIANSGICLHHYSVCGVGLTILC